MSNSSTHLKFLKIFLFIALGLQVLIALLLLGKYPLLFRGGIYSQARVDREGMLLAVYGNLNRSGPAETRFAQNRLGPVGYPEHLAGGLWDRAG